MAGRRRYVTPGGEFDIAELACEIVIVIISKIRIQPMPSETLEQMRLPKIADVVVDATTLVPMRDQLDIAYQYQQKDGAEEYFERLHRFISDRPALPSEIGEYQIYSANPSACTVQVSISIAVSGKRWLI